MQLYHFHSSSTSFRVRIALGIKGLDYESVPVTMRWRDGDHDTPAWAAFNPQRNLPVLVDGELKLVQSMAICEYLEERYPTPPLLPADAAGRARVRSLAQFVACELQPLNNLRVERHLAGALHLDAAALRDWRRHWIGVGFDAIERMLADGPAGALCHGDAPTLADCFLVPQVYNALRPTVGIDLDRWPAIRRAFDAAMALPAVERALPRHQPGFAELTEH